MEEKDYIEYLQDQLDDINEELDFTPDNDLFTIEYLLKQKCRIESEIAEIKFPESKKAWKDWYDENKNQEH